MNIYFIRHGESEANRDGILQGEKDFPLSTLGVEQAKKLGEYFASITLNGIYSSHLTRALETAKAIESFQAVKVSVLKKLKEVGLGPFEGKTRKEIEKTYPEVHKEGLLFSGVDGTETKEEITARIEKILTLFNDNHNAETIAVISHGGFISILLSYLIVGKQWPEYHRPFRIDNTGVTLVEFKDNSTPFIHYTNKLSHLERLS